MINASKNFIRRTKDNWGERRNAKEFSILSTDKYHTINNKKIIIFHMTIILCSKKIYPI